MSVLVKHVKREIKIEIIKILLSAPKIKKLLT